jgi:hypothetical protein
MEFSLKKNKSGIKLYTNEEMKQNTVISISPQLKLNKNSKKETINLIYQFFIPANKGRAQEIIFCLKKNFENLNIDKIYLLNEKIYTDKELGLNDYKKDLVKEKIKQINIKKRLQYNDICNFVEEQELKGYIIVINCDIFLDNSIQNLLKSDMGNHRSLCSLIRYEYRAYIKELEDCPLFGERGDSQDTWIFHSKYNIQKKYRKAFKIYFGQPGCDNKWMYLHKILGYKIYNDPKTIKTYHFHSEASRNYSIKDQLPIPFMICMPYKEIGYGGVKKFFRENERYNMENDNKNLISYLNEKIKQNRNFVIPRFAGIENEIALIGKLVSEKGSVDKSVVGFLNKAIPDMKIHAGIKLSGMNSLIEYSNKYLEAFENCEMFMDWDPNGNVYPFIKASHGSFYSTYHVDKGKQVCWARTMDIFDYIYNPWTQCLKGKKILIISSFADLIQKNMATSHKIYGNDLFPKCTFCFLKPPQTNGTNNSSEFNIELEEFCKKIKRVSDDENFDIALVSCGGYGNLVCNYIYSIGKSSIYVGGVLQMYFGILGKRWKLERQDILKLYLNEHWLSPKNEDKPQGHEKIENSCYW